MGIVVPFRGRKPLHVANSTPASLTSNPAWRELKEELQERSLQSIGVELTRRVLLEAMEQEADELVVGRKVVISSRRETLPGTEIPLARFRMARHE